MSWVAVGLGGGAVLGLMKSQQEQRNQKAQMMANAAQIQYSPWTHANVQVQGPTSQGVVNGTLGGALQGGLTGAMIGQQLKTPTAPQPNAPMAAQGGLGSTDYARQLNDQANKFQASQMQSAPSAYASLQQPNFYRNPAGY